MQTTVVRCIACGSLRRANLALGHQFLCAGRCHTLTIHGAPQPGQREAFEAEEAAKKEERK